MSFTRRGALSGLATATAGIGAAHAMGDDPGKVLSGQGTADLGEPILGPRINFAQAEKIMTELGIDALLVGEGVNVYHLTGHWPLLSRMGYPPGAVALLTRRSPEQPILIMSSFTYYYQLADVHKPADFPVYIFTAPAEQSAPGIEPAAGPLFIYTDRGEVDFDAVEAQRLSLIETAVKDVEARANLGFALKKALQDAGVTRASIATDSPLLDALLADIAPDVTTSDAGEALSRIRPVKSDREVRLMRRAAQMNAEAALDAVRTVEPGMSYRALRAGFFAEAARRGNSGVFMVVDRIVTDQYDRDFVDGQAFLIDAVSAFDGYHGDYGRTVFIGEPPKPIRQATEAIGLAWDEVREAIRPGMKFSDIRRLGQETLRKQGVTYGVPFNPHSVGLFHTDHLPNRIEGLFAIDPVLEKNMIISVDCPLTEAGIGGSCHLEDLILVTNQGGEAINRVGDQIIYV